MTQQARVLGHSGIRVSTLALGTMMFGSWGNEDADECHRMVHRAIDAGITLFDTADIYDNGVSEAILGAAVRGKRDQVVLATKVGNPMDYDVAKSGLSRRWIMQACDDSLRRLGVDHIDLYQAHRPDPNTSFDEIVGAFNDLVAAGKIRAFGTSTFSVQQVDDMVDAAFAANAVAPTSEQPPYSALARGIENDVLAACSRNEMGVIVWAPLNGGWLTGKYQQDTDDQASRALRKPEHFDHADEAIRTTKRRMVDALIDIAAQADMSLKQLALAFVLDDPTVTAAIIGPRTLAQLDELLEAGHTPLPVGVRNAIDAVIAPGTNVNPADAG
jgi:aryl-alcohol dehydrogenase-like predicted oxidoreductase